MSDDAPKKPPKYKQTVPDRQKAGVKAAERKNGGGRNSLYRKKYDKLLKNMINDGHNLHEVAAKIGVTRRVLNSWKYRHPSFGKAWKALDKFQTDNVEQALYKRAVGFTRNVTKAYNVGGELQTITFPDEVIPDTQAAMHWLRNKRPDDWSEGDGAGANAMTISWDMGQLVDRAAAARDVTPQAGAGLQADAQAVQAGAQNAGQTGQAGFGSLSAPVLTLPVPAETLENPKNTENDDN